MQLLLLVTTTATKSKATTIISTATTINTTATTDKGIRAKTLGNILTELNKIKTHYAQTG